MAVPFRIKQYFNMVVEAGDRERAYTSKAKHRENLRSVKLSIEVIFRLLSAFIHIKCDGSRQFSLV